MTRFSPSPRFSFLLSLFGLLALLLPAVAAQEAQASGDVDLKSEIDKSVRWLRSKQAPDGNYGGDVKGTAWALQALAASPRAYTRRDGPFVAKALDYLAAHQGEKGGIHDAGANELERTAQSVLSWLALSRYEDEESVKTRTRLEGFFSTPVKPRATPDLTVEQARAIYVERLARRKADYSWSGPDGAVVRTSEAIIDLSRCYLALEAKAGKAGKTATTRKLPPFDAADRTSTVTSLRKGALFLVAVSENGLCGGPEAGTTAMALGALQKLPALRSTSI